MTDKNLLPAVFSAGQSADNRETDHGYQVFESLSKKLLEQFTFFYEYTGNKHAPVSNTDIHAYQLLKQSKEAGYKAPDGSNINLKDSGEDLFGEVSHCHLQRYFLTGQSFTTYPNNGFESFLHNTGLEIDTGIKIPLSFFVDIKEITPYIIRCDYNYYTELTNRSFLSDKKYDIPPKLPVYHQLHKDVFSKDYLKSINIKPIILALKLNPDVHSLTAHKTAIRTVNFALRILYSTILIQSAFTDLYGTSVRKKDMIEHIKKYWGYPDGKHVKEISLFHLHILNYLLSASHMNAYMISYCLYRDKYGKTVPDTVHTSIYMGKSSDNGSFKIFLEQQIRCLITEFSGKLKTAYELSPDNKEINGLLTTINALVYLGSLWGIGYSTDGIVGKNNHHYKPVDLHSDVELSPPLKDIDLTIRHNAQSPFWKLWHNYAGMFWHSSKDNKQVRLGKGPAWGKFKKHPRAWAYHLGHQYSSAFWQEYFYEKSLHYSSNQAISRHFKALAKKFRKGVI